LYLSDSPPRIIITEEMPRYYVAEWVSCPICRDPVRITRNNIIFKHDRIKEGAIFHQIRRMSDYCEICPASRTPYIKEERNEP
jgi:hypothetical protein